MKIKVIIPNSGMDRATLDDRERMLSAALSSEAEISVDCIEQGPESIESMTDEVLAGPEVLKSCIRAEKDGFDAVVIYCGSDVAVEAVRENVDIPVIGPGEASIAVANVISERFTAVTTTQKNLSRTERRLKKNPVCAKKMIAVRALNIPVAELRVNPDATKEYLDRVCQKAVEEDGADALLLTCLGMAKYGAALEEKYGIRVLDMAFIAVAAAEMAVRLDLKPARSVYPKQK